MTQSAGRRRGESRNTFELVAARGGVALLSGSGGARRRGARRRREAAVRDRSLAHGRARLGVEVLHVHRAARAYVVVVLRVEGRQLARVQPERRVLAVAELVMWRERRSASAPPPPPPPPPGPSIRRCSTSGVALAPSSSSLSSSSESDDITGRGNTRRRRAAAAVAVAAAAAVVLNALQRRRDRARRLLRRLEVRRRARLLGRLLLLERDHRRRVRRLRPPIRNAGRHVAVLALRAGLAHAAETTALCRDGDGRHTAHAKDAGGLTGGRRKQSIGKRGFRILFWTRRILSCGDGVERISCSWKEWDVFY